jgi:arylsulfatase A-like enzyme
VKETDMPQPNLLFIFTDQQRADTMSAYGNERIRTPNFNRLAERSTVFSKAYVTQTVCIPSRASIMTGLTPHSCDCPWNSSVILPLHVPCLPEMINTRGYHTAYMGKWHLGDEIIPQHGFAEWRAIEDCYWQKFHRPQHDPLSHSHYHHFLIGRGYRPEKGDWFRRPEIGRLPEEVGKAAFLANEASRFLGENAGEPFILYVNFLEPHGPMYHPANHRYDPLEIPLPESFHSWPSERHHLKARLLQREWMAAKYPDERAWREFRAQYWGMCSLVDAQVGRILSALEESGQADNTIVVYTSDHGDMAGEHGIQAKAIPYEGAARVPLLVRLPGQTSQRFIQHPVSQIDLVPTLLDLLGQPIPDFLEGVSWKRVLEGADERELPEEVVLEWNGTDGCLRPYYNSGEFPSHLAALASVEAMMDAIRDSVRTIYSDGWKFNCSPIGQHELFDLISDPLENVNLYQTAEHAARARDMWHRLLSWQRRTRDPVFLPRP